MDNQNINIYENYYIYDDSIPYITETAKKNIEIIKQQINEIQLTQSDINEETQIQLNKLQKEIEKQIFYINPVTMKDYMRFFTCVNCISIEKNKIPDPKIISMSYLDFLFHLIDNDSNGVYYSVLLCDLLNLCCGVTNDNIKYIRDENNKVILILGVEQEDESIFEQILNKNDFDEIKNIILHQNMPNYDDTYIDPKIEKALRETEEFMNKHKKKIGSLEDQIICVLISTPLNLEQIKNLTVRKFSKILQRVDYKMHYEIYKTASMSGLVSFKEEIDHWMSDISIDKFANKMVDFNQLKNKIQSKAN
jgi:hypothetical protein